MNGAKAVNGLLKCPKCGAKVPRGANVCPKCKAILAGIKR